MLIRSLCLLLSLAISSVPSALALGSSCSAPLGAGKAAPGEPYWLQNITHQGTAPYAASNYTVFRNVKDFGAVGDGLADDTEAINAAIADGDRCGEGCGSTTVTPAVVYFPQGTYLVSAPILVYYYTEIVGDARELPTILASPDFNGSWVLDADPNKADGSDWYINQDSFYRSIRNLVIDLRDMNATSGTGIHWEVSQATSLYNIVVEMSDANNTGQLGIFQEDGSGGFMADLVFNGGAVGLMVGNQVFTVRNVTVNNAKTAVSALWGWAWTWQGVTINNCSVGFEIADGVGSETIIDAVVTNTPIFIERSNTTSTLLDGSFVLNNIQLENVTTAVGLADGTVVLEGGTTTIDTWVQGDVFSVYTDSMGAGSSHGALTFSGSSAEFAGGSYTTPIHKPASLLDEEGRMFGKTRPTYADYSVEQFVSVKDEGAVGDGETDDTAALQAVFDKYAGCKIIYFDAGIYIVSSTLKIPAGVHIVGEAWTQIMASGDAFADIDSPTVAVQVGKKGSTGFAEFSSFIFTSRAPAGGAIIVEWNVHDPEDHQGAAGMWDVIFRLGGAEGTNLQLDGCGNTLSANETSNCQAAFLSMHITPEASAYLEGTWFWLADHDLDTNASSSDVTLFSGRGILSESRGPVWMIGTASEHHVLYMYNFVNAADHYVAVAQTESAYFQPAPAAPEPFSLSKKYHDPPLSSDGMGWAMNFANSTDVLMLNGALYVWFSNYSQSCQPTLECQKQLVNVDSHSTVTLANVNTVGTAGTFSVGNSVAIWASSISNRFTNTASLVNVRPAQGKGGEPWASKIFQQLMSASWGPLGDLHPASLSATVFFSDT
ncbi:glycoside hydrolase family 55 protein [Peniophora sp. CONT]|nr:glycoside hydrolase family 55 protein [Peniophora sp. CONT]